MATPQSNSAQPKIVQRLLVRTAGFLFALAIIFGGYRWATEQKGDFDRGGDSAGLVAAIRRQGDGQQAVLIRPDGKIVTTKSWHEGATDREPVWAPDGRFLYFCSDREESTFHVLRWNPEKDDAEARTTGRTSRSNPTFSPGDTGETLLIVSGGAVRELDPRTRKTPQILPPANAEIAQSSGDESGTEGSFNAIYGSLGKSFRIARYLLDKRYIAAVMRRDEGELLVLQDLKPVGDKVPKPRAIVAGDHIEFDVNPKDGSVVFSVQNFRWPEIGAVPEQYRKGNRITYPFRNAVGIVDPVQTTPGIVVATPDDKAAFGSPRISPDGNRILLIQGALEEGSLRPAALLTLPYRPGGIRQASPLVQGDVYEPSWSPDGKTVAFAKRVGGKRDIYTITAEGASETNLTKGQGDFATPLFSPTAKGG